MRRTSGGIKALMGALTEAGTDLGFDVRTRFSEHPKVYWRTTSEAVLLARLDNN